MNALGIALLLVGALALAAALWLRRGTGLPWVAVVAEDTGTRRDLMRPLFARRYGLVGKPDYLLEQRGTFVPVELKPGRRASAPYDSDLMQLAAYCLLVEESTGRAPPYGLLRYAAQTFRLTYTPAVRAELVSTLAAMRELLDAPDCERSHDEARRCAGCGFAPICDDSLLN